MNATPKSAAFPSRSAGSCMYVAPPLEAWSNKRFGGMKAHPSSLEELWSDTASAKASPHSFVVGLLRRLVRLCLQICAFVFLWGRSSAGAAGRGDPTGQDTSQGRLSGPLHPLGKDALGDPRFSLVAKRPGWLSVGPS